MLICVTNRKLCKEEFLNRINELAKGKPNAIMLREKDLNIEEYESLALKVKKVCDEENVNLIINKDIVTAVKLKIPNLHLSMDDLRAYKYEVKFFKSIGSSVHSVAEAKEAQKLGATYIVAGHIFSTDCKKGVPPRGISFLRKVCEAVSIPVYAIGGISIDKTDDVLEAGAKGYCIMSEAMTCSNPIDFVNKFNSRSPSKIEGGH